MLVFLKAIIGAIGGDRGRPLGGLEGLGRA